MDRGLIEVMGRSPGRLEAAAVGERFFHPLSALVLRAGDPARDPAAGQPNLSLTSTQSNGMDSPSPRHLSARLKVRTTVNSERESTHEAYAHWGRLGQERVSGPWRRLP